jgi:RNA polymerase sigma-70 factor, ECF subfamily
MLLRSIDTFIDWREETQKGDGTRACYFLACVDSYTVPMNPFTTASSSIDAPELSDDAIVQQVLAGRTVLFELLMRRYNERIYRAARAIVRDDREAEDVMQQAYVNAFENLRQFRGQAQFSTWLTRIAVNEALARLKKRDRYTPLHDDHSEREMSMANHSVSDPERQAFGGELLNLLESAIDRLPDGSREVFVLREVEDLSTAETAASLGVSEDVVKTRLSRARAALRRDLFERTGAVAAEAFRFHRSRCDRVVAQVLARLAAGSGPRP